ncbi:Branched-chain amino acid aminotransferase/4-amino-4-deoxychorismate lyase [Halomicronema hongdechloris C2206]|uniref:Branched-chain amino acid aminotransferase/4-amino-4-deoxychorismate lyase n=1 Tax=Halomicronema hongdechloris C2206 TaxID=1641165 RepID=A0A1Z3HSM0_9CYAN|nr:aminotransferase class IV [Halomicronema hongdechloris]ASC73298.1 Branched-chain amino acid aminotransferase/4-amino-4-deoxychorismate lyase [Halomicronema hongdechloris C2206]
MERRRSPLDVTDPAWRYGATVFTTLRVHGQDLAHPWTVWEAHCDRIRQSLATFHWPQPDWPRVRAGAAHVATHFPVLRLTILADGRELVTGRPLPDNLAQRQRQGISAWESADPLYRRSLPGHKTGNYLSSWLALQAAQRMGASEAILVDEQGHWLETATGNLWGWGQGTWWTPPLAAGILPGVMRSQLLRHLQGAGATVSQTPWTPEVASQIQTLAYSNSVIGVIPIHTLLKGTTQLHYNPDQEVLARLGRPNSHE